MQDVIFEKGTTHIAIQPRLSVFSDNNDPFKYKQDNILMGSVPVENSNQNSTKITIPSNRASHLDLFSCKIYIRRQES